MLLSAFSHLHDINCVWIHIAFTLGVTKLLQIVTQLDILVNTKLDSSHLDHFSLALTNIIYIKTHSYRYSL